MGLTARRDLELGRAVENGNVQLGTERELDERHRQLAIEIGILAREEIVLGDRAWQVIGVLWAVLFGLGVYAS